MGDVVGEALADGVGRQVRKAGLVEPIRDPVSQSLDRERLAELGDDIGEGGHLMRCQHRFEDRVDGDLDIVGFPVAVFEQPQLEHALAAVLRAELRHVGDAEAGEHQDGEAENGLGLQSVVLDELGHVFGCRRRVASFLADDRRGAIRLSEELEADGELLLKVAREHQLEGIIAKDRNSPYRSGRFGDWVKIKCVQSGSFAIVGYELSMSARGHLAGLMLAARRGGELVYVGHVGPGFKESEAWKLRAMMNKIPAKRPAVAYAGSRKDVVWVRPTLIAEIEFIGWTADGKLRHASYKGLRERRMGRWLKNCISFFTTVRTNVRTQIDGLRGT